MYAAVNNTPERYLTQDNLVCLMEWAYGNCIQFILDNVQVWKRTVRKERVTLVRKEMTTPRGA